MTFAKGMRPFVYSVGVAIAENGKGQFTIPGPEIDGFSRELIKAINGCLGGFDARHPITLDDPTVQVIITPVSPNPAYFATRPVKLRGGVLRGSSRSPNPEYPPPRRPKDAVNRNIWENPPIRHDQTYRANRGIGRRPPVEGERHAEDL